MVSASLNGALSKLEDRMEKVEISEAVKNNSVSQERRVVDTFGFRVCFFVCVIYFLFVYGFSWFDLIIKTVYNLVSVTEPALGHLFVQWTSITVSVALIVCIFVFLLPLRQRTKEKFSFGVFWLVLVLCVCFVVGSLYAENNYTFSGQFKESFEQSSSSFSVFVSQFKCLMDPACAQKMSSSQEAETVDSAKYSIKFRAPASYSQSLDDWKKDGVELNYLIASSGEFVIKGVRCYQNEKDDEHLLDSTEDLDMVISNDGNEQLVNLKCNLDKLKSEDEDEENEKVVIIPELIFEVDTTYMLSFPLVSQDRYYDVKGFDVSYDGPLKYHNPDLSEYMKEQDSEFEIKQSNDVFDFNVLFVDEMTPFVFGNEEAEEFTLDFEISLDSRNSFGKLVSTQFVEEPVLPKYFSFQSGRDFSDLKDFEKDLERSGKFVQKLYLVENENEADSIDLPIIRSKMSLKLRSVFNKEDSSSRFRIYIDNSEKSGENGDGTRSLENSFGGSEVSERLESSDDEVVVSSTEFDSLKVEFESLKSDFLLYKDSVLTDSDDLSDGNEKISYIDGLVSDIENLGNFDEFDREKLNSFNEKIGSMESAVAELKVIVDRVVADNEI